MRVCACKWCNDIKTRSSNKCRSFPWKMIMRQWGSCRTVFTAGISHTHTLKHTNTHTYIRTHACGQSRTATTGFGEWERTLAGLLQLSSHRSDIARQMTRCGSHWHMSVCMCESGCACLRACLSLSLCVCVINFNVNTWNNNCNFPNYCKVWNVARGQLMTLLRRQ